MGKRRQKSMKEGELANFPEEQKPTLLSPRYLAIATALILVSSAFASLLLNEDVTGFATSAAMQRWRDQDIVNDWGTGGLQSNTVTNQRDQQGRIIASERSRCPKPALPPPPQLESTSNRFGCFNAADQPNQRLIMCNVVDQTINGEITTKRIKCVG